jgi:hypothetical protein
VVARKHHQRHQLAEWLTRRSIVLSSTVIPGIGRKGFKNVVSGTPVQNEIDDGFNQTTSANSFIQIDPFVNGESVANEDVVVWYGASFIHNDAGNLNINPDRSGMIISGSHVVGPDIRPIRW